MAGFSPRMASLCTTSNLRGVLTLMDERNFLFLFYGFAAVWVLLAGYVLSLAAREKKLRRQLDTLKRMLEDREKS
mgnify:CR=1 FL=1